MQKAYSTIEIKEVDTAKRIIRGIASAPSTDRMGDIVEPEGAEYNLPIPLLWQHNHDQPIGYVTQAKITKKGIEVVAELVTPTNDMPNGLFSRLSEAWASITSGLVRGLSIGFTPLEYSFIDGGGVRFSKWDWHELSAVTIPANADATITTIKKISDEQRAALGNAPVVKQTPVVAGTKAVTITKKTGVSKMNLQETIKSFKATIAEKSARIDELLDTTAKETRTFEPHEAEEHDTLAAEVKQLSAHVKRLEEREKAMIETATPVSQDPRNDVPEMSMQEKHFDKAPAVVATVKNDEPGMAFARLAMAMHAGKGNVTSAKAFAEAAFAKDKRLQSVMKAAVAAGSTTNAAFAGVLVDNNVAGDFIEYLRPRTIIGQFGTNGIPSLRRVPFNIDIKGQNVAGTAQWVGEGFRKPVTAQGFFDINLGFAKIAGITVISDELDRFADPSIQRLVRDDLTEAIAERMDTDFVDPSKAAATGASKSPASITNGVTPVAATANPDADINGLWAAADAANLRSADAVYITDVRTARALSSRRDAFNAREYPEMGPNGGRINGVPVIVSNHVPANSAGSLFILAFASEILLADDGFATIDVSNQATIFMDDSAATAQTATGMVSMFQTNQLAIRAERWVNWGKRRAIAVSYLNGVNW